MKNSVASWQVKVVDTVPSRFTFKKTICGSARFLIRAVLLLGSSAMKLAKNCNTELAVGILDGMVLEEKLSVSDGSSKELLDPDCTEVCGFDGFELLAVDKDRLSDTLNDAAGAELPNVDGNSEIVAEYEVDRLSARGVLEEIPTVRLSNG